MLSPGFGSVIYVSIPRFISSKTRYNKKLGAEIFLLSPSSSCIEADFAKIRAKILKILQ